MCMGSLGEDTCDSSIFAVRASSTHMKNIVQICLLAPIAMMMRKLKPEDIFAVDPKIRFVGLANRNGQILFSKMREGIASYTPDSIDRTAVEDHGRYFIEKAEQEAEWSGMLEHIAVSYEKYVVLIIPLKQRYALITLEKDTPAESYASISKAIRALDKQI